MEFARRGRVDDDADDVHRFVHLPPPHVDPMLVIREALLSQLQKDRLRQEIIQAELAKIEHAIVLRSSPCHGTTADDVEWTKPVPFTFREQSMPPWQWSVSQECYVNVDEIHDPKHREGKHKSVALKSEKLAMEDHVHECLRPCCCNGKADLENSKLEEQKLQESNESVQPKTTSPSMKWELTGITIPVKKRHQKLSCQICQVQVTSKQNLQVHCAGRKHRSKEASNQKAQLTEESFSHTGQETSSIKWSCSTCQVNGTSESDLKKHLNRRTHQQNIEAQLMEGDGMVKNNELQEPKCHKSNAPQHSEKPPSMCSSASCLANCANELELRVHFLAKLQALLDEIRNISRNSESREATVLPNIVPQNAEQTSGSNSGIFQADSDCQLGLEHQIGGKIHQLNVQDLHEEAKKTGDFPPEIAKNQQPPSEWDCVICQAKCYSASQFANHCRGKKHQKKMDALQGDGVNVKSSNLTTETNVASNGSDSNSSSSEKVEEQTALWSCGICNLQCSSESMLQGQARPGAIQQTPEQTKPGNDAEQHQGGRSSGVRIQPFDGYFKLHSPSKQSPVATKAGINQMLPSSGHQQAVVWEKIGVEVVHNMQPSHEIKNQSSEGRKAIDSAIEDSIKKPMQQHLQFKLTNQEDVANNEQKSTEFNEATPEGTSTGVKRELSAPGSPVKKQTMNARQDVKEVPEHRWTCTLCQARCTSASDYRSHLGGRRHRENEEARRGRRFYCALCGVQCNSENNLESHLGGRRHQETLEGSDSD